MHRLPLFMQVAAGALLLCQILQLVQTYQFPETLGPAIGDVAVISILLGDIEMYFESVVSKQSGASENWQQTLSDMQNATDLMSDFASRVAPFVTESPPQPDTPAFATCVILQGLWGPLCDATAADSYGLATAAKYLSADAQSQFLKAQNASRSAFQGLSSVVVGTCSHTLTGGCGQESFFAAGCAMECLTGQSALMCDKSNFTCP